MPGTILDAGTATVNSAKTEFALMELIFSSEDVIGQGSPENHYVALYILKELAYVMTGEDKSGVRRAGLRAGN